MMHIGRERCAGEALVQRKSFYHDDLLLKTMAAAQASDCLFSKKAKTPPMIKKDHGWSLYSRALDLAGTQTTRADVNRLCTTVYDRLYATDVGLPSSVGLTIRVRYVMTEHNALATKVTFCHGSDTSCFSLFQVPSVNGRKYYHKLTNGIIPHFFKNCNSFFIIFLLFLLIKFLLIFSPISVIMMLTIYQHKRRKNHGT
jgi:hypothetical protein